MNTTQCDNHPDREAVTTIGFVVHDPGFRYRFYAGTILYKLIDLCEECNRIISPILKKESNASN